MKFTSFRPVFRMDATTTVLDVSLFSAASYHISICTPKHTNIDHVSYRPYTILIEVKYKVEEIRSFRILI